ncbi:hypothetical protein I317_01969 [Kwoniella heveanensis CBS 569]|nr:hypothetical protein I317_01969 [Kwoniella heveanensis CBS 569]
MTADELETFLKTEGSESTGWSKDDGSGESIGHESGRKIVDILKRNPDKDPSKYTDEDKEHMRRVVSYCKRHLAQEDKLKESKSPEELEQTKSTRSLKNWGHDPLKTLPGGGKSTSAKPASSKGGAKPPSKKGNTEKPKSKGKAQAQADKKEGDDGKVESGEKPAATEKPKSKGKAANAKTDKADEDKAESPEKSKSDEAEVGDKREAETAEATTSDDKGKVDGGDKANNGNGKPPSKKAKTTKEPTEPTRKPPSRGVKKA